MRNEETVTGGEAGVDQDAQASDGLFLRFVTICLVVSGSYGILLMLPLRLRELGADPLSAGYFYSATGGAALLSILMNGAILARLGLMPVVALSVAGMAVGLGMFAGAPDYAPGIVAIAALVFGLGWGGFFSLILVVVARLMSPAARIKGYAILSIGVMVGFGLSPVAGAALLELGWSVAAVYAGMAACCAVCAGLFLLLHRPISARSSAAGPDTTDGLSRAVVARVLGSPACRAIVLTGLSACVFSGTLSFQAALPGGNYDLFFLTYTLTVVAARIVLFGRITQANIQAGIAMLLALVTAGLVVLAVATSGGVAFVLGAMLFGFGYGAASPLMQSQGANLAPVVLTGATLQTLMLAHLTGVFFFPVLGGAILSLFGATMLYGLLAAMSAGLCIVAILPARKPRAGVTTRAP